MSSGSEGWTSRAGYRGLVEPGRAGYRCLCLWHCRVHEETLVLVLHYTPPQTDLKALQSSLLVLWDLRTSRSLGPI